MKKIIATLWMVCLVCLGVQAQVSIVQGVKRTDVPLMAESNIKGDFSLDKVNYFVGEGENVSLMVIQWGDKKGADKLVWGYRWKATQAPTGLKMMQDIAAADPRLYMLIYEDIKNKKEVVAGLGFNSNGKGDIALLDTTANNARLEFDKKGLARVKKDDFEKYVAADAHDHWACGWYKGFFFYKVADGLDKELADSQLGAGGRKLVNHSVDYWEFSDFIGREMTSTDYFTYVPKPAKGVFLPEEFDIPLSDDPGLLPVCYYLDGAEISGYPYWETLDAAGNDDYSVIGYADNTADNMYGELYFSDGVGLTSTYLRLNVDLGEDEFVSNTCKVNLTAPVKPITGIAFEQAQLEAGLFQKLSNTVTLTPADATYTSYKLVSDNEDIVSIDDYGGITTKSVEGTTVIRAISSCDETVQGQFTLTVKCKQAVESVKLNVEGTVELAVKDILGVQVEVLPENADYREVEYEFSDPSVAGMYEGNLVAYKAGETTMTVKAMDGRGAAASLNIVVKERDHSPYNGYQDGTFLLNEGWFGHGNGNMNFLTPDGEIMYRVYERENPNQEFGATACYGMVYGDKFFVASKQPTDGDPATRGGGRLVVFDAKTLKYIKGFDDLAKQGPRGLDGRALVGVSPSKIYISTDNGILPLNTETLELGAVIPGTQCGQGSDMVKAGDYVFAVVQNKGALVLDAEQDTVVTCLGGKDVQAVTQTMDGNVWLATLKTLKCINPATLEIVEELNLPENVYIGCAWGAWKSASFCASRTKNVLYWNASVESWGTYSDGRDYYRYEIGKDDISTLKPFFTLKGMAGHTEKNKQSPYGSLRYDDRSDELVIMTTQPGWGTNYEYNWIHLVNGTTGELNKTIALSQYYWFQSMPIFPDKYAPEIDVEKSAFEVTLKDEPIVLDLTDKVIDQDNLACNIRVWLKDAGDEAVVNSVFAKDTLTITPVAEGTASVVMAVESNGVVVEKVFEIQVKKEVGIEQAAQDQEVVCVNNEIRVMGCEGYDFVLCSVDGQQVASFHCDSQEVAYTAHVPAGVYVLRVVKGENPFVKKMVIR